MTLQSTSQLRELFSLAFSASALALVNGEPLKSADDDEASRTAGMVCFFGQCIRGAFIVGQPAQAANGHPPLHGRDWLGEMANQLAGRVKSALHAEGIDYIIAPPLWLHGDQLKAATFNADCRSGVSTNTCRFHAWALLNIVGPLPQPRESNAPTSMKEGDIVLF